MLRRHRNTALTRSGVNSISKKIVLITSGQPALNPRLVKEADTLAASGYNVTVIYSYWNEWGTNFDKQLLPAKKWKAVCVGGDPVNNKLVYQTSRIIHKLANKLLKTGSGRFADWAIARSSFFLARESKKYRADLYIGHNLGSLPAVIKTAKLYKKPCGFDAEDFHRYEVSDNPFDQDVILKTYLEDKYFPQLTYLTSSSPLISAEYYKLYPQIKKEVIVNVFPEKDGLKVAETNGNAPVKLFWFSQTTGLSRGIEDAIDGMNILNNPAFELHLLGNVSEHVRKLFTGRIKNGSGKLHFHQPVSPDNIIEFASQFDIGLALENSSPFNRDICLTNKIFTYIQAGLAVIASGTTAQTALLKQHPLIGKTFKVGDAQSLAEVILHYQQDKTKLFEARKASLTTAHEQLNWEMESKKFLSVINQTLNKVEQ